METGSIRTASSASKSMFLGNFAAQRKVPAHTVHVRPVALSPCRKTENECPDLGVCLQLPISVSRFHKRIVRASGTKRAQKKQRSRLLTHISVAKRPT
jgi:hypothetical protein